MAIFSGRGFWFIFHIFCIVKVEAIRFLRRYSVGGAVTKQLCERRYTKISVMFGSNLLNNSEEKEENKFIAQLRKEYSQQGLDETFLHDDPMVVFDTWLREACNAKVLEPNAMCLSTCVNNMPSGISN
jgi:hypothetical protein